MSMTVGAALAALYGTQALARAGGNIAAGAQEFNRDDRERLQRLERQQALGRLGMSPVEQQRAQRQIVQPLQGIERQAEQERSAQLASQDLGQGAAFRQMQAQEATRQQGRLLAQQMLQQQQEAAITRDQAEIQALRDARKRRRQMMITGSTQAVADTAGVAAGAIQQQQMIAAQKQYYANIEDLAKSVKQSEVDAAWSQVAPSFSPPPPITIE